MDERASVPALSGDVAVRQIPLPTQGLVVTLSSEGPVVTSAAGEVLDPCAAQVLTALGGFTPPWLPTVEGLHAAWSYRFDPQDLSAAAAALDLPEQARDQLATVSADQGALVGLASAGVVAVAANPQCPAAAWDLLRLHPDESVRWEALKATTTLPPGLAGHPDPGTRARAARNTACTPQALRRLSEDPDQAVLVAVAGNTSAPRRLLRRMVRLKAAPIRAAVAGNTSFPIRSITTEWLMTRSGAALVAFAGRTDASGFFLHRVEGVARSRQGWYRPVLLALQRNPATPKRLQGIVRRRLNGERRGLARFTGIALAVGAGVLLVFYVVSALAEHGQASGLSGPMTLAVAVLAVRFSRRYYRRWRRSRR